MQSYHFNYKFLLTPLLFKTKNDCLQNKKSIYFFWLYFYYLDVLISKGSTIDSLYMHVISTVLLTWYSQMYVMHLVSDMLSNYIHVRNMRWSRYCYWNISHHRHQIEMVPLKEGDDTVNENDKACNSLHCTLTILPLFDWTCTIICIPYLIHKY